MAIDVGAVTSFTNTATGNQDFTDSNFGGGTPKVVIGFMSRLLSSETDWGYADTGMSCFASDGTNTWSVVHMEGDNQAVCHTAEQSDIADVTMLYNTQPTPDSATGSVSFITNGVRINWTKAPAGAYGINMFFFGGDDVSAAVGTVDAAEDASTSSVSGLGFQPNFAWFVSWSDDMDDATDNVDTQISIGMATDESGGTVQRCVGLFKDWAATTMDYQMIVDTGAVGGQKAQGSAWDWENALDSWDSGGFTLAGTGTSGTDKLGYVAIRFANASFALQTYDSPTSTGNDSVTGVGTTPKFICQIHTAMTAVDTNATGSPECEEFNIGVATGNVEFSVGVQQDNGVATSNTARTCDNDQIINNGRTAGNAYFWSATYSSFDSDGYTLNYATVEGTSRKFISFAVGEAAAGAGIAVLDHSRRLQMMLH